MGNEPRFAEGLTVYVYVVSENYKFIQKYEIMFFLQVILQ